MGYLVKQVVLKEDEGYGVMKKLLGVSQRDRVFIKFVKEGEEFVGVRLSECNVLVIENDFYCCLCIKCFNEEKKLQVQEFIVESLIDKQVVNEKFDGRCNSVVEIVVLVLVFLNYVGFKKFLSDDNFVCGYVKKQLGVLEQFRNVEEFYR